MRRELIYDPPSLLHHSILEDGKSEYDKKPDYFSKVSTYFTKYGVVVVVQMNWRNNFGRDIFTVFKTALNGFIYRASIDQILLNDASVKWWATHFIKNIPK